MGKNRGIVQSSKEEHRQLVRAEKQKAQFEEQTRYQRYQVKGNYIPSSILVRFNLGPFNFWLRLILVHRYSKSYLSVRPPCKATQNEFLTSTGLPHPLNVRVRKTLTVVTVEL